MTYRTCELAFCKITAASIGLLHASVDGATGKAIARVTGLAGAVHSDTCLCTVCMLVATSIVLPTQIRSCQTNDKNREIVQIPPPSNPQILIGTCQQPTSAVSTIPNVLGFTLTGIVR